MERFVIEPIKKGVYIIFLTILIFIILLNVFKSTGYHSLGLKAPTNFNIVTLVIALLLILVIYKYRKTIISFSNRFYSPYIIALLLIISGFLQFIILTLFNVNPSWDFYVMVDESKQLIQTGTLGEYFTIYPNNILMVCILAAIGKVFSPTLFVYQLFNISVIILSQYLICAITLKLTNKAVGLISLVLSVFFFPYMFYSPIVYTDTFSLLLLLLPLHILISKTGKFRKNSKTVVLASILFSLGMILKGSLIIFVIAFGIILFLNCKRWKRVYFLIPFLTLLLVKTAFNFWVYENGFLNKQEVEKYSFPTTHWIVMGQNSINFGKWSGEDVERTKKLLHTVPKKNVTQLHLKELKKRIKDRGLLGNINFTIHKIGHTWTDGTYYSLNKLKRRPVYQQNFTRLIDSRSGYVIQAYARIIHIFILFGSLFLVIKIKKDENPFFVFSMFSLIGFFLFFIIWEARSRYLLSLTPLLIIMCCYGYFGSKRSA